MNTRHFSQLPKPYLAYPKVIQGLVFKKPTGPKVLPQVEYVVDSFQVDQKHLQAYNEVCGFKNDGFIPAIYLAVLSQSLQMHMMTTEAFPFAVLGLVHIRNQVKQTRKIGVDERLTLSCKFFISMSCVRSRYSLSAVFLLGKITSIDLEIINQI